MDKIASREILSRFAELVDGTLLITKELPDQFSSPMILALTGHGKLRPDQIPGDYMQFAEIKGNDNIAASIADTSEIIMMTVGQFVSGKGCVELALAQKGSSLERLQMHLALLETILQSLVQQGIIY